MKIICANAFCICIILLVAVSCSSPASGVDGVVEKSELKDSIRYYKEEGKALRNASRYQEALAFHRRGLSLAGDMADTLEVIQALNNIGTVYRRMGLYEEAASWHYSALTCCEEWSDKDSETALKNKVISLNGIGNVHLSSGNDSIALQTFREALKGESELGSATGMAINFANIGAILEDYGLIDSARYYYAESLKWNLEADNSLGVALCNNHFGRLSEIEGDYENAFKEYGRAYDILNEGSDRWHWLSACTSLSRVCINMGDYSVASRYLAEAQEVAKEIGAFEYLADIYRLNYRVSAASGDYRRALRWLEKQTTLSDSLDAERNENQIFDLRSKYEQEKSLNEMRYLRHTHQLETRRNRMILTSVLLILFLAAIAIVVLVYALWLRSRNQKMLGELNQTKSNYFTNIAHEFRTPLTVILSAARSICDNPEDTDGVREDSKDIITHSRELLNLVNQVLEISRMTSSIAPEPVWRNGNLTGYVSGICERYERYAAEIGIRIVRDLEEEEIVTDFVPDMVMRIVGNLISNALKYSGRGTTVTLSMSRFVQDEKDFIRLSVSDEGEGMNSKQIEDIFKPFFKTSVKGGGASTGIGLYVVKLSAEAMGGNVEVSSTPGEGTLFTVSIPLRRGIAKEMLDVSTQENESLPLGYTSVNDSVLSESEEAPRILIVEDRAEVARWEMRQLDPGYSFYFAADGEEGLRIAEEIVPDLIITDIMMPVMDGLELCRRVRSTALLSHIPIIVVTAKTGQEERIEGLQAGADAYLEKPYNEEELSVRVRLLLEQRKKLKLRYSEKTDDVQVKTYSVTERDFLDRFNAALDSAFTKGKVDCEELASELCVGRVQLNRKMKAITGYKTTEYIHILRMAKAKELLETTALQIGEIAMKCGIDDVGYFSTIFRKSVGVTPTAYRNR